MKLTVDFRTAQGGAHASLSELKTVTGHRTKGRIGRHHLR
jgi:hypothetical protein